MRTQVVAITRWMGGRKLQSRHRRTLLACFDAATWPAALLCAELLRYNNLSLAFPRPAGLVLTAATAAAAQLAIGTAVGLYRGRWRVLSFEAAGAVAFCCCCITVGLMTLNMLDGRQVPESVPIIAGASALVAMLGGRYLTRVALQMTLRTKGDGCTRLLVFGAGHIAEEVIPSMLRDADSPYLPVALLDDDPSRRHLSIMGVPVVGDRFAVKEAAARYGAETLLIAVRAGSATLIRELSDTAREAGLQVRVMPSLREVIDGTARRLEIRKVTLADLLGRREVRTDLAAAARYLTGRRVLVTGAGGSIGSELCRQINGFAPAELIMLDRDETALHTLQLSLEGHGLLDSPNLVLLDIRDRTGVEALLAERRPHVVFHAAALKHLPILEQHPGEAVQTNVWGTLHLLEASVRNGVDRFVNISTDKAVDPSSVLGYSKRICERLTAAAGARASGTYLSVRFGNVLGSRGSVLHAFEAQIAAKGPVTVTDPNVCRYFMTVEEAVQLVLQAAAIGCSGEALVLDMGQPVRIAEVAERMIAEAHEPIDVVYTGLRRGEKLTEELFACDEVGLRRYHPLISHVEVPVLHPGRVKFLDPATPPPTLVDQLSSLCRSTGLREGERPCDIALTGVDLTAVELTGDELSAAITELTTPSWHPGGPTDLIDSTGRRRCVAHRRVSDADGARCCDACTSAGADLAS